MENMLKYKKILLVDDDGDDRQIFKDVLEEMDPGTALETAENGLEMITSLDNLSDDHLPDMIILDQNMPRMTGKETLRFLKDSERYRHIPVVIYSTYRVKEFSIEYLELGALDVVAKPDSMDAYREMIRKLLAGAGG